jgi:hypothetical protein
MTKATRVVDREAAEDIEVIEITHHDIIAAQNRPLPPARSLAGLAVIKTGQALKISGKGALRTLEITLPIVERMFWITAKLAYLTLNTLCNAAEAMLTAAIQSSKQRTAAQSQAHANASVTVNVQVTVDAHANARAQIK